MNNQREQQKSFIRQQANNRWPSKADCDRYAVLNKEKPIRRRPSGKKPATFQFTLLEIAMENSLPALRKLLTAASLKIKVVRRHPGFVLQRTYNHGNRPIKII